MKLRANTKDPAKLAMIAKTQALDKRARNLMDQGMDHNEAYSRAMDEMDMMKSGGERIQALLPVYPARDISTPLL